MRVPRLDAVPATKEKGEEKEEKEKEGGMRERERNGMGVMMHVCQ